jgi:hypothetical protein
MKPFRHIPQPPCHLLHHPPHLHTYFTAHTLYLLGSLEVLSFLGRFKWMCQGITWCVSSVSPLSCGLFESFHSSPLPLGLTAPIFNSFQYIPSQMLCFTILLMLCHSLFLSLLPWVPQSSSTVTNMFYMSLYMIMLVFAYMFILRIYLPGVRENMQPLPFWAWLTSLNMMSSSCVHLNNFYFEVFLHTCQNFRLPYNCKFKILYPPVFFLI